MTADQRFQVIMWALGVVAALAGVGVRGLWKLAAAVQRNQDTMGQLSVAIGEDKAATQANTRAIGALSERMARVEVKVR
jgi:hypothetical protein